MSKDAEGASYEVLSPWAEADPVPFRGIAPRIAGLAGKRIGLLRNTKRAASPIMEVVSRRLSERFPGVEFTEFLNPKPNEVITEQDAKAEFEKWLEGVDAVIATFGD